MKVTLEQMLLFLFAAFLVYHFFLRGCIDGFTPLDTIQTSLDESINNPSCCISNTAGYIIDPVAVSEAAPGFATKTAYANPCN